MIVIIIKCYGPSNLTLPSNLYEHLPHPSDNFRYFSDGWHVVEVPALPGCISQGKTKKEALENIKEAIELYLEPEDDYPLVRTGQLAGVTV